MLRCEECWCVSDSGMFWFGYIAEDPEDGEGPVIAVYCPPCAAKHFDAKPRERDYT